MGAWGPKRVQSRCPLFCAILTHNKSNSLKKESYIGYPWKEVSSWCWEYSATSIKLCNTTSSRFNCCSFIKQSKDNNDSTLQPKRYFSHFKVNSMKEELLSCSCRLCILLRSCHADYFRRQQGPVGSTACSPAIVELMENSIPQTTTLFNRMYKRGPMSSSCSTSSNGTKTSSAARHKVYYYASRTPFWHKIQII